MVNKLFALYGEAAWNASVPIACTLSPIVMFVRLLQLANILYPIYKVSIFALVRFEQPENVLVYALTAVVFIFVGIVVIAVFEANNSTGISPLKFLQPSKV